MSAYPEFPFFVGPHAKPARARVVLEFTENGERIHEAETGWAMIFGSWLFWRADVEDDDQGWQSFPRESVICVDWLLAESSDRGQA